MSKYKKSNSLLTVTLLTIIFVFGLVGYFNVAAKAATPTIVNPNTTEITAHNNFLISKTPDKHKAVITLSGNTDGIKQYYSENGRDDAVIENQPNLNTGYYKFDSSYGSSMIDHLNSDTIITADLGVQGSYKGEPAHVIIKLSDLKIKSGFANPEIRISDSMYSGFTVDGVSNARVQLFITDNSNKAIAFAGDTYISFNSLNPKENQDGVEFVAYAGMNSNPYYITNDSIIKQITNPVTNSGEVLAGDPAGGVFEDTLGSSTFTRATASFQISGENPSFTIGTQRNFSWYSFNSATLFKIKPDSPTKSVVDASGNDENGKTVGVRTAHSFLIKQRVNVLGTEMLERYKSMTYDDDLPNGFNYTGAELLGPDGKTITDAGKASYDSSSRHLKYTVDTDYLSKKMIFEGGTYTLKINGTIDPAVADKTKIENKATVTINDNPSTTNTVSIIPDNPPVKSEVTKQVSTDGQNWNVHADIDYGKDYYYKGSITVPNDKSYDTVAVREDFNNLQTYKDFKVTDASGNDVLDQGKLTTVKDGELTRIVWTANKPDDWLGKTVNISLTANLAKLSATDKDSHYNTSNNRVEVTNTIDLLLNNVPTPSTETSVTPMPVKQSVTKYLEK